MKPAIWLIVPFLFCSSVYAGQFKDLVVDYGADPTGIADSTAAINAACTAAAVNDVILVPAGNYKKTGTILCSKNLIWFGLGAYNNTGGLPFGKNLEGITENNIGTRKFLQRTFTHDNDYAMVELQTQTSHTGGTAGFVTAPLMVDTYLNTNINNDYINILSSVYNSSTTGAHAALGGLMQHNAGAGWGAALIGNFVDASAANDPTAGQVSLELDNQGNGTDNAGNGGRGSKVFLNIVGYKYNPAGAVNDIGFGVWVNCQNNNNSLCHYKDVFDIDAPFTVGFDTSHGTLDAGGAAFRSKENQDWVLGNTSAGQVKFHLNSTNRRIEFLENGVVKGYLDLTTANHAL